MGFSYPAYDQMINHVARIRNRSRHRFTAPMVIRLPYGGGIGAAEHHSESTEAIYTHIPGLKVVVASTPENAKGPIVGRGGGSGSRDLPRAYPPLSSGPRPGDGRPLHHAHRIGIGGPARFRCVAHLVRSDDARDPAGGRESGGTGDLRGGHRPENPGPTRPRCGDRLGPRRPAGPW